MSSLSSLSTISADVIIEVATRLDSRADLLNFCLTSHRTFSNLVARLYEVADLKSVDQCLRTLHKLANSPQIARHVRTLAVRPDYKSNKRRAASDRRAVAIAIREVASSLDVLHTFIWDAEEIPPVDDMWFALRMFCPHLRHVGVSLGSVLLDNSSHLFDFANLSRFTIRYKHGFYTVHANLFLEADKVSPSTHKLWNMLINRCPDLQEIFIEGESSHPTEAYFLTQARWPNLRKLSLGDVTIDGQAGQSNFFTKSPFIEFLEAHDQLRDVRLSRHNVATAAFLALDPNALSKVTLFEGTPEQLRGIPQIHSTVKSVTFRNPTPTQELTLLSVAGVLQNLSSLTELRISFTLHSVHDGGSVLRSLIASCPHIRMLDITCAHRPFFQVATFSRNLRGFSKLRSFSLSIVKFSGDEAIPAAAARIARTNPQLETFELSYLPPSNASALPTLVPLLPSLRVFGSYSLTRDEHGLALTLKAHEERFLTWPMGLTTKTSRRYVSDLRPVGYYQRRNSGFVGVAGLLLDKSAAGDEARVITFCFLLVTLACWGYVACLKGANS